MSLHTLGQNDVTEEMQAVKDRLGSKDAQIAAQQSQLLKKAAELDEIKVSFGDALRKLNEETQRVLRLETDLTKCSEDLRNEQIASENNRTVLKLAQEKMREKEMQVRQLESTLESFSYTSASEANSRAAKAEREKGVLEARIRELEANLRQLISTPVTPGRQQGLRRSSSLSNIRIISLETQLNELRVSVARKDEDVTAATKKLENAQRDLVRADNALIALEAKNKKQVQELEDILEEKEAELEYLKTADVGQGREEELIKRIEEDEAKIVALERLVGEAHEVPSLRDRLARTEHRLREETFKVEGSEGQNATLTQEREEAMERLEIAQRRIEELEASLRAQKEQMQVERASTQIPDEHAIEGTARLLSAVERLRAERDDLRRDVEFIQMEHKFKVAALEAHIATISTSSKHSSDAFTDRLRDRDGQIARLGKGMVALSIVNQDLHSSLSLAERTLPLSRNNAVASSLEEKPKSAEEQLSSREDPVTESDDLVSQLESESQGWKVKLDSAIAAHEETKADLLRVDAELTEVISERDSLSLQVENLTNDLESANRELEEAEKRYSSLQFHQLNNMSSTEANSALKTQITELEGRVLRRNELIGIQQHDIKRMETNLRLQEERLNELTAEMETLASEKEAMVEDCAAARDARDDVLSRVEQLEDELEKLEAQLEEKDHSIHSLIHVTFDTAACWRGKMRLAEVRRASMDARLQAVVQEHEQAMQRVKELELDVEKAKERLQASESNAIAGTTAREEYEQRILSIRASDEKKQSEIEQLQNRLCSLQATIAEKEASHHTIIEELRSLVAQKDALLAANDLEGELVQLKMKHVEELGRLQSQLVETTSTLEEAKARHAAAELELEGKLSESLRSRETMENRLADLSNELAQSRQAERDLALVNEEQVEKIRQLDVEVSETKDKLQELKQFGAAAEVSFRATIDDLTKERDELEVELGNIKNEMEEARVQLEEECRNSMRVTEEVSKLGVRLQEEVEVRARLEAAHRQRVKSLNDQVEQMESKVDEVERKYSAAVGQLKDAQGELELLQEEKHTLQCDMTALEAQIQRAKTYDRYQESQLKESERKILNLEAELEKTRNGLAAVEKAHNAAEMKLNMQNAHQKRVDQELAALKARPDLEQALAELEERNDEMEELLKRKCAEIEQNDDRVIEMLKENKKLMTKVESLTRKVQNLQTKLAAAKASAASPPEKPEKRDSGNSPITTAVRSPPVPIPHSRSFTTLSGTVVSPPGPESVEGTNTQNRGRTLSVASILRPRSPDKNVFSIPVFRGSSSPKRRSTEVDNPPPPVTGSRKRSAPEDFETSDNIPAQVFTADSLPESRETKETSTPRVRRVLSNIQSGFTPVRHRTTTDAAPPPSTVFAAKDPAPRAISIAVPSVSSTPVDSRAPKRGTGWLGKIRGASSHPGRQFGDGVS
ncbi:hypothetical protein E1B28_001537 [Marasmius oreades]|uniref:Uncharacterized protein n=1 Tax=Marasmius oreades TaxID=181124 RepID=A0A9P8AFJ0_9AGAR|nr:uncharacterized protein E1B28_001537 [Marasmius oreades]KAG7099719.1 hypothetical protein E1B28_001537 [Marasmius oreades]